MKLTKKQRVLRLLAAMGYTRVQSRSAKYEKYSKPNKPNIWVGERGALRTGETLGTAINMTNHLPALFKQYNI